MILDVGIDKKNVHGKLNMNKKGNIVTETHNKVLLALKRMIIGLCVSDFRLTSISFAFILKAGHQQRKFI